MNKKITGIIAVLLLAVSVIFTVSISQKQQEIRQQAQTPVCSVQQAICAWDSLGGGYNYRVNVTDTNTNAFIAGTVTSNTQFIFPALPGATYRCNVSAINNCGEGQTSSGIGNTCPAPVVAAPVIQTPTPTSTPTPTPTPTPIVVTVTPAPTPTPVIITITPAPTPTPIIVTVTPPPTPTPSLAPTGSNIIPAVGIIGTIISAMGLLLLFGL